MKLVYSHSDNENLHNLKERLVRNGIPAVINGENTGRIMPFAFFKASLWIYVDDQYEDAISLINNPDYIVKNQIDIKDFENKVRDAGSTESVNKMLTDLAMYAFFLIALGFILLKVLQWLQT